MTDKKQKKVYLPEELADMLDAHPRSNSDLTESALASYLNSGELEDIERRLDELDRRESVVESERNERNRELERIGEKRRSLEKRREKLREKKESKREDIRQVVEQLSDAPRDPENPAVKTQARKIGVEPDVIVEEMEEQTDTTDEFSSL